MMQSTVCWNRTQHLMRSTLSVRAKGTSSNKWLQRQRKDPLVRRAAVDQYRCRSAYKLTELDDKFRFLSRGAVVVDCGACPGAWSQVAAQRVAADSDTGGMVLALDVQEIALLPGVIVMSDCDVTNTVVQERVRSVVGDRGADVVMSDMAPNASGLREMDHQRIMQLAQSALALARLVLRKGGVFVCKLWQGSLVSMFRNELKANFSLVKECHLKSTRKESSELFIYAKDYTRHSS